MLNSQCRNPQIRSGNGSCLCSELRVELAVVECGLLIREQNSDTRSVQKDAEKPFVLARECSACKSRTKLSKYRKRYEDSVGPLKNIKSRRIALTEVSITVGVDG